MPNAAQRHRNIGRDDLHRRRRLSPSLRGYDETWKRARTLQLNAHPLCAICNQLAAEVDHIVPFNDGGERLDSDNLQSLCCRCHWDKTSKERSTRFAAVTPATQTTGGGV
jgi:5-methylcytosine-specific restriction protein A